MNKEVIKKYKKEFDHWLNGGKVLCRDYGNWVNVWASAWDYSTYTFVINDEYVTYRKALAEGKIVTGITPVVCRRNEIHISHKFGAWKDYKIKPDEPEFKVGMYVKCRHGIAQISSLHGKPDSEIYLDRFKCYQGFDDCKPWTFEEADDNEWVIAEVSTENLLHGIIIDQVRNINKVHHGFVVPYIGQTPAELGLV